MAWHLATLAGAALLLLYVNRRQWFFGDEFDFIASRGLDHPIEALFTPHNEHWSTLPILVYRGLLAVFGLTSYWPFISVLIALHLALAHLLWRALGRCGVPGGLATGLVAVFAVLGAGSENLLWAFQIGFVGSVLLGYGQVLLVDHDGPSDRRDALGLVCALGALLCSGIAIPMVVMAGLTVLLRRRRVRPVLLTVGPPAGAFLAWYAWKGRNGGAAVPESSIRDTLLNLPDYVRTGLTSALERLSGLEGSGVFVLLALLAFLAMRARWDVPPMATAGAVTAVALYVFVGLGRTQLGAEQAASSRYAYISLALLWPLLALALESALRARWSVPLTITALILVSIQQLLLVARADGNREQELKAETLAAASLVSSGARLLSTQVEPVYSPDLTLSALRSLVRQGLLPSTGTELRAELTERARLQTTLDAVTDPGRMTLIQVVRAEAIPAGPGCVAVAPAADAAQLVLSVPAGGGGVQVRSDLGGDLQVFATRASLDPVGKPRTYPLAAGQAQVLHATGMSHLIVTVPPTGVTRVCQLDQPVGGP